MLLVTIFIAWFVSSALAVEIGAEWSLGDLEDDVFGGSNGCSCGKNYKSEYEDEKAKTKKLEEQLSSAQ